MSGKRRIALVTNFSPQSGGGAVILRSLIPHLFRVDVTWYYFGDIDQTSNSGIRTVRLGPPLIPTGSRWKALLTTWKLWKLKNPRRFQDAFTQLTATEPDAYWLVAHAENIPFINYIKRNTKVPVYVSVEDDLMSNHFARSWRYHGLHREGENAFATALKLSDGIDFTSQQMLKHYNNSLGVTGIVTHRYIKTLPTPSSTKLDEAKIHVGLIGSMYSMDSIQAFIEALLKIEKRLNQKIELHVIGSVAKEQGVYEKYSNLITLHHQMKEADALKVLSRCRMLYSSYPFEPRFKIFRQTSAQVKLTTYALAQRKVFAHTPADSTLAQWVSHYNIGTVCDSLNVDSVERKIAEFLEQPDVNIDQFTKIRSELWGVENVERLESLLLGGLCAKSRRSA